MICSIRARSRVAIMTHRFLSPAWIDAVRQIRHELDPGDAATDMAEMTDMKVRANVTIVDAPFEVPTVQLHLDTSSGTPLFDEGHLSEADFMIEMPYSLAYEIFVERDPAAVMPVLLGGQVKLTGDASKLLMLADSVLAAETPPPGGSGDTAGHLGSTARRMTEQIDAITLRNRN